MKNQCSKDVIINLCDDVTFKIMAWHHLLDSTLLLQKIIFTNQRSFYIAAKRYNTERIDKISSSLSHVNIFAMILTEEKRKTCVRDLSKHRFKEKQFYLFPGRLVENVIKFLKFTFLRKLNELVTIVIPYFLNKDVNWRACIDFCWGWQYF